jgi:hypothetical protein
LRGSGPMRRRGLALQKTSTVWTIASHWRLF